MVIFTVIFVVFLIFFATMSVGVLMGRKPISGSCGGVGAALKIDGYVCDFCGNDPNKCESQESPDNPDTVQRELGYNALTDHKK